MNIKISAAHSYADVRAMASRIKDATDDEALNLAAMDMAPLVPDGAVLVPAPSSSGLNHSMVVLAGKIAVLVPGAEVVEAVRRITPVPSSLLLRRAGKAGVSVARHVRSMTVTPGGLHLVAAASRISLPRRRVVVVDNVVAAGHTIAAVGEVLGLPLMAVVYADASREARTNPSEDGTLRVCVSGSRGFCALWKVPAVLKAYDKAIVVHGGARGVDQAAEEAAVDQHLATEIWKPDWSIGRAAGPMRNKAMVASCDFLVAFWDGKSRGTASAIRAARDAGIPYEVILDGEEHG